MTNMDDTNMDDTTPGALFTGGTPLTGHTDRVEFASIKPSSGGGGERLLLTGSRDCTLHLWDLSISNGKARYLPKRSRRFG